MISTLGTCSSFRQRPLIYAYASCEHHKKKRKVKHRYEVPFLAYPLDSLSSSIVADIVKSADLRALLRWAHASLLCSRSTSLCPSLVRPASIHPLFFLFFFFTFTATIKQPPSDFERITAEIQRDRSLRIFAEPFAALVDRKTKEKYMRRIGTDSS